MQAAGMRVIPYINGQVRRLLLPACCCRHAPLCVHDFSQRNPCLPASPARPPQLFDTLIPRWKVDNATLAVQKFAAPSMKLALTPHLEHFDHITSAVMCPHTRYWRGVMRDTVLQTVTDLGFDGCYVDQVGNGEKRNCADPSHNHTLHGGSFWAEAFYDIMGEVRATLAAQPEDKPRAAMFMTEGITEEVAGPAFDIQLGLNWKEPAFWSAIYGGYVYATGGAGSIKSPLAGGLCTELTKQFMVGGTMGWFSESFPALAALRLRLRMR